jgi:hypothetical protein
MNIRGYSDFRFEDHASIVTASKIIIASGCTLHRMVLRKDGEEFITHRENLMLDGNVIKHVDFYEGHYFKSYDKAVENFIERCKSL